MDNNRFPQMVHEHFVQRVRHIMQARHHRIKALKTRSDAERYVRHVRHIVNQAFTPYFPADRCDLNARVTGKRIFDDFVLEKVVFQSRPDFLVTANLYRPRTCKQPAPAVLGLCGHSRDGKFAEPYKAFSQGLARKGFVTLIIDPISQGERWQHDKPKGAPMPSLCHAHNLLGNQMFLVDDFFGSWRAWDGIRGLDYLLSRPEVDPKHIGVTGNSGGGTLASYLTALDARFTMAAPSCYICSMQVSLENELPSDAEQNPPGILAGGLDQADLLLAYAPRATLILAQQYDFFDNRFSRQAYEDIRHVHALLGSEKSAAYFCGPTEHGYSIHNREAMYDFFLKQAGLQGVGTEPKLTELTASETFAAPRGKVAGLGSRRVFDFTREKSAALKRSRGRPSARKVAESARKLLGVTLADNPPHYRVIARNLNPERARKRHGQYLVETDIGILTVMASCGGQPHHPQHLPTGKLIAYVGNTSGEEDLLNVKEVKLLLNDNVVVIDPRGIGQSEARTCGSQDFFAPYHADYLYAVTSDMLNECYLGRRVHDTLRAMDLLYAQGAGPIKLVGRGLGSITAAFAALLHPKKPAVTLLHYLPSYRILAEAQYFTWPLSALPRGVLSHFDLPDVYRALGKRLHLSTPFNEQMKPV